MEILKPQLPAPSPKANKIIALIFLLLGTLGFLDASYLTIGHFRGIVPSCRIVTGCNQVLLSRYSTVGPIPLALLGVFYYAAIIFGSILYLDLKKDQILRWLAYLSIIGISASAYFVYLQIFVIRALCFYCLISALTSSLIFLNGIYYLKKFNK